MEKEEEGSESELLKELRTLREQLEKTTMPKEEGVFEFETRVDGKGRLNIPPDIREEMGTYGKAAKVSVKVCLIKLYGGTIDVGSV